MLKSTKSNVLEMGIVLPWLFVSRLYTVKHDIIPSWIIEIFEIFFGGKYAWIMHYIYLNNGKKTKTFLEFASAQ